MAPPPQHTDPTPQIASLLHCTAAPGHPCNEFHALISHTRFSLTHSQDLSCALTVFVWLLSTCASGTASKHTDSVLQTVMLLQSYGCCKPTLQRKASSKSISHSSLSLTQQRCSKIPDMHLHHLCALSHFMQSAPMQTLHLGEARMTVHIEHKRNRIQESNALKRSTAHPRCTPDGTCNALHHIQGYCGVSR